MLTIRSAQMAALNVEARRRFLERTASFLRTACPETATLTDREMRTGIEQGLAHAARYKFETEGDLRVFLECRFKLGEDFDVREDVSWARAIVRDDALFPSEKATALADGLLFAGSTTQGAS